jgi:hypothetical protein
MKKNLKGCFTLVCYVSSRELQYPGRSEQTAGSLFFFFSHCLIRLLSSDFQRLIGLPAQPDRVTEPVDRYVTVLY